MKLNKPGQLLLAAAASAGVATLLSACATLTVDFVYVTSAKAAGANSYGEIDVFEVNSESGRMRQIPTSPFPSGGRNPVAEAVSTDHNHLYVVNHDDNSVVDFTIGNDGKVYPQQTVNTPGIFPVAAAVSGSTLFVADTYQPLPTCSTASPCSGSVAAFPIAKDGTLGAAASNSSLSSQYWPLSVPGSGKDIIAPVAVAAAGSNVYVAAYDTTANTGYVFAFALSNGTPSLLFGGVPVAAGIQPSAIATDPSGSTVYVTDSASNNVLAFSVGSTGLTQISGSPFAAGNAPSAIVVDATGKYAYVANFQDSNVIGYSISGGQLSRVATYATGTQPVAIGIDPSMNQYLYTANFLANNVSGFRINANDGTLLNTQFSPFAANANPTAVAAIPHNGSKK